MFTNKYDIILDIIIYPVTGILQYTRKQVEDEYGTAPRGRDCSGNPAAQRGVEAESPVRFSRTRPKVTREKHN